MFGFGKRKGAATPTAGEPGGPVIAAVLLDDAAFDLDALRVALGAARIAGGRLTGGTVNGGVLTLHWGDDLVGITRTNYPYPASDLDGPCATARMWPPGHSPADAVRRHRVFLLVTMTGGRSDPVRRRLAMTQVTAVAAGWPGVTAVYWPESTQVFYPPVFVDFARELTDPAAPPLYLWVDFRVFRNADGTSGLFTTGLAALGRMEVEIPSIDMPPGELREWSLNIAYYLLDAGDKVKDGDTIGVSAEHRIRIRYGPGSHGQPGRVMQLLS